MKCQFLDIRICDIMSTITIQMSNKTIKICVDDGK